MRLVRLFLLVLVSKRSAKTERVAVFVSYMRLCFRYCSLLSLRNELDVRLLLLISSIRMRYIVWWEYSKSFEKWFKRRNGVLPVKMKRGTVVRAMSLKHAERKWREGAGTHRKVASVQVDSKQIERGEEKKELAVIRRKIRGEF